MFLFDIIYVRHLFSEA